MILKGKHWTCIIVEIFSYVGSAKWISSYLSGSILSTWNKIFSPGLCFGISACATCHHLNLLHLILHEVLLKYLSKGGEMSIGLKLSHEIPEIPIPKLQQVIPLFTKDFFFHQGINLVSWIYQHKVSMTISYHTAVNWNIIFV